MDPRILLAGALWLVADALDLLRDSIEISRSGLLIVAGKVAGL